MKEDMTMDRRMGSVQSRKRRKLFILLLFLLVGYVLWLTWYIPYRFPEAHSVALRFFTEHLVFAIALSISLVFLLVWLLLWKLPQWQVADVWSVKDRLELETQARTTIAQILGGAAFLVGLYFTAQTLWTTQVGQIADRFTKAIDHLGKDTLAIRLGGIYALEQIAKDSENYHWAVMEVLTAFIREQTQGRLNTSGFWLAIFVSKDQDVSKPPADIQAMLTVLGRRLRTYGKGESQQLVLYGSKLRGADLRDAHLEGAILWNAHLEDAILWKAYLEKAELQGAHLEGAILSGAHLKEANLQRAHLKKADLRRAHLEGANLQEAHLEEADLREAHLHRAFLWKAHLEKADLRGAHLERVGLQWGADLEEAHLEEVKLQRAHLEGVKLRKAHLEEANLQRAHLKKADLRGAHLEGVDLQETHLEGADLRGVDLTRVRNLTQDQVNMTCVDEHTRLPESLTKPAPCPANPYEF
jgi:uncharacterized protein YjbI with pentapeptide repeats